MLEKIRNIQLHSVKGLDVSLDINFIVSFIFHSLFIYFCVYLYLLQELKVHARRLGLLLNLLRTIVFVRRLRPIINK